MDLYSVILKTGLFCLHSVFVRLGSCNGTAQMEDSRKQMPGLTQPFRADTTEPPSEPTNLPGRAGPLLVTEKGGAGAQPTTPGTLWISGPRCLALQDSRLGVTLPWDTERWTAGLLCGPAVCLYKALYPATSLASKGLWGSSSLAPLPHGYPEPSPLTDIF